MKLAFSTNAYRKYTIEESIKSISKAGYSVLELMCDEPHAFPPLSMEKIKSIQKTLKDENMEISNLNGFMLCAIQDFHHPSWIEKDKEQRQMRIEHTKNCIKLAKQLGVSTVSTEPGGPKTGLSTKQELELFEKGIKQVLEVAEDNKVKLLIEPEPDLLIENSSQFLNFFSRFDTKFLGLNFDIGHFFCVGENPSMLIKDLREYIDHIHLEDISVSRIHQHLIPGKGVIDFKSIFDSIKEINYDGYVTIELYPYQANPDLAAKNALEFLKPLL